MSRGDDVWVTYNGEIYNYVELREELSAAGFEFSTQTDTEVLLAGYQHWGLDVFERLRGMWGLVILDGEKHRAVFSRDRLGIKPLFVTQTAEALVAASEIKQLFHVPGTTHAPNEDRVLRYLLYGEEGATDTFFEGVESFPAAHYQVVNLDSLERSAPQRYWWPERVQARSWTRDDAAAAFHNVFTESIAQHMRSDVPVGCALSGGLDSSSVAAAMYQRDPRSDLHSFTATFPGHSIDERSFAEDLLRIIPATPHFVAPTADRFLEDFDTFVHHHDEPVGSLSQYAGFCVARATRQAGIPVTLNGQGGDEVFSAYWQCYFAHLLNLAQERHPLRLGKNFVAPLLPKGNRELFSQVGGIARRYWARRRPQRSLRAAQGNPPSAQTTRSLSLSRAERRVWEITELTLPRLLKWDDRSFMAFSVEGRYPFLDHRLIETCLSFDDATLYWRGWTKEPLRHGLRGQLPPSIARRRTKVGFETPTQAWMQLSLQASIQEHLDNAGLVGTLIDISDASDLFQKVRAKKANREEVDAMFRVFNAVRWARLQFDG